MTSSRLHPHSLQRLIKVYDNLWTERMQEFSYSLEDNIYREKTDYGWLIKIVWKFTGADERARFDADLSRGGNAYLQFQDFLLSDGKACPELRHFCGVHWIFHCSADFLLGLKENVYENDTYKPVQPFHERLRAILRETETSQYLFVKRTKISWGVFYHWLTGKSKPSLDNLIKVANYFDCSVDFLLGRI